MKHNHTLSDLPTEHEMLVTFNFIKHKLLNGIYPDPDLFSQEKHEQPVYVRNALRKMAAELKAVSENESLWDFRDHWGHSK